MADATEVSWMWGDASIISHALAKANPLRWSKKMSAQELITDLEKTVAKDKYNSSRPVLLSFTRKGTPGAEEHRFRNPAAAVAILKKSSDTAGAATAKAAEPEDEVAVLVLPDGQEHRIRILKPQMGGEQFLDIRDLYARTHCFTFDPGYGSTGSCVSAITFIDGPQGVCLYRGYPVQDLCEKSTALETAYLLLAGELPTGRQLQLFTKEVCKHMIIHEKIRAMFGTFSINAHPMAIMVSIIGTLSSIFSELDCMSCAHRTLACTRLVAKVPVLAAMAYKTSIGQPFVVPRTDHTFAENWLRMMFATPMEEYKVNPLHAKAIDAFMILHMDHEQNASTSTVRTAGSSQANPYACVAAGVASLWGAAHGGANEAVVQMLESIGSVENVAQFVEDVKAKKAGVRLMGFGHRVYKNYDPRARYLKKLVEQMLPELGVSDPLLVIAKKLEEMALADEYFVKRKLYPNVDFYSGLLLRALGIPTSMFTVMFAMSRTVGWMAHWHEMITEGHMRITRPRQLYIGSAKREYDGGEDREWRRTTNSFSEDFPHLHTEVHAH